MADSAFNLAQAYLYFEEDYTFKAAETYLNEALQLYTVSSSYVFGPFSY